MELSRNTMLLSTKIKIPAPRKNYIVRQELFRKLSQCDDLGVIFIRGGAGTGKTTLLSTFIRENTKRNFCWMTIDATNSDVYSFWIYFTASLSIHLEDGENLLTFIRVNSEASSVEQLLIMLINSICGDVDYYIVLDDVHNIREEALVKSFEFFLNAMPSNLHLIMLSREDPPVYLGVLAVSGRFLYIDGKQMLLSPQEGMTFLKDTMKMKVAEEELIHLNNYAEGWIGGLQLVAAAGAGGKYAGELLRAGGGIATEYLTREVFETLTPYEKDFLLKTGFLSYFDSELCSMLFENFGKADFDHMMEELIGKNLFIICMDEQNGIYRYHNILSEYLTHQSSKLEQEERIRIYQKSALAFEKRHDYEEALRLYDASSDYVQVMRIAKGMDGRVEAWNVLDRVPLDILIKDEDLTAQCFMYNMGKLKVERCKIIFEAFQLHYADSDIFKVMKFAEVYFTKNNGIMPSFYAMTAEQIEKLELRAVTKAMILIENSTSLVNQMHYEEAELCVKKAIQISSGGNVFVDFYAYNQLAQIYEEVGRLEDSLLSYKKSEQMLESPSFLTANGTNYYFGLTGVYMRRMELDKAQDALAKIGELIQEQHIHVDITDMTRIYHETEMYFLRGLEEQGIQGVYDIISKYPQYSILTLGRLIYELDCAGGLNRDIAEQFIKELEQTENYRNQPFMRLLRARLLFKQGIMEEAMEEIEDVLSFSRLHDNKVRLVEADIIKIFMLVNTTRKEDKHREINNLLCEAIHYAHENRILMPFYLDRETLLPLLIEWFKYAQSRKLLSEPENTFTEEILTLCGYVKENEVSKEGLSIRELEVLSEIALGITNREIAEKLCISQATVKSHLISIFGKLEVSSRLMAVEKGKQYGLIK